MAGEVAMNIDRRVLCALPIWALGSCASAATAEQVGEQVGAAVEAPADFARTLELREARRFNANDLRSFVHRIFSLYDHSTGEAHLVGPEVFRSLLADDVRIDFPDYQIHNWDEFVIWHGWIHGQLVGDDHVLGPIDVRFLDDGHYQAHFVVLWRALYKTGEFREAAVEQTWRLREQAGRDQPVLESVLARLAGAAPAQ
jgi:hypothetical protein